MIKVKLGVINATKESWIKISKLNFGAKDAFTLFRFFKKVQEEFNNYTAVKDQKTIEYGEPVEGKRGEYKLVPEKAEEYWKELVELEQLEVEFDFEKLNETSFNGLEITPYDLIACDWFIEA